MSTSSPEASAPDHRLAVVGLVLTGVWATLLGLAVALWARVALFPGSGADGDALLRWVGAPFALVALGLLWWLWRAARDLRGGRRQGWTPLLVLGAVVTLQAIVTARPLLAPAGPDAPEASASPREIATGLVVAIVLGLVSVTVAVLGRRRSATATAATAREAREARDDDVGTGSVSDPR